MNRDERFDEFFTEHYLRAGRFACAMVGAADAEDALQDAFLRLYRHRRRWPDIERLDAYFYRILYNVCRNRLRRQSLGRKLFHLFRPERTPAQPGDGDELRDAWQTFSPTERAVFYLMDYQGRNAEDTAGILDIQPATVRVHRHRLRRKIVKWEAS